MHNLQLIVINQIFLSSGVYGHGHITSPRSRNFVAFQDGVWSGGGANDPMKETCSHCLNRGGTAARCGKTSSSNYDYPVNFLGGPMPKNIQATYNEGDFIDIEVALTAHHKGHFTYYGCAINEGEAAEQSCFDKHPLTFVEDNLYGAPQDPNYPGRAYIPLTSNPNYQKDNAGDWFHSHKYQLPHGLVGDLVLIQWHWVTANSCLPEGYEDYDFPEHFDPGNLITCEYPLPVDGNGTPEQFWNCAEVEIIPSGAPIAPITPAPITPAPITPAPVEPTTPTPVAPISTPPPAPIGEGEDSRLIAYLGNWQSCPTTAQTDQYTHIVIAFAVSYTWSQNKNICDTSCNIGSPVPICNNQNNQGLVDSWRDAGKKVILSFGGAGMGGSWDGDVNDCWDYCYGKEAHVINQLTTIVNAQNFDGIDIDYEYFYESQEAQNFLRTITTGLRSSLPAGSIVTHAPMDPDLLPEKAYYQILKEVSSSLDFIMPQYYNGYTRPAIDGIDGTGDGSISALSHYNELVNDMFDGEPEKVVFGFCISDCSGTGSNANKHQAVAVMSDLRNYYPCNGGAFFWVADHDTNGSWSKTVSEEIFPYSGCSSGDPPTAPQQPVAPPTNAPVASPTCVSGHTGLTLAPGGCTHYYHCVEGSIVGESTPCPSGTLFSESLQHCTWTYNVDCDNPSPVSLTQAPVSPTLAPVPPTPPTTDDDEPSCSSGYTGLRAYKQCTKYYHCVNGVVTGDPLSCPANTLFSEVLQNCDWDYNVEC
jgi:hypothetical protein